MIRDLRQQQGLTLEQVGDAVGVGKSTVRKWETGDIRNMGRDKIAKLARILGTTPDYLAICDITEYSLDDAVKKATIGGRIKQRREELQISQDELAKKLGYKSRSSINKIEVGSQNLTQPKIKALAIALETTPSFIMGWDEEKKSPDSNRLSDAQIQLVELAKTVPEDKAEKVLAILKLLLTECDYIQRQRRAQYSYFVGSDAHGDFR